MTLLMANSESEEEEKSPPKKGKKGIAKLNTSWLQTIHHPRGDLRYNRVRRFARTRLCFLA